MKKSKVVKWMGRGKCDVCKRECGDVLYDGKTIIGVWGVMCSECFRTYGVGLGTGRGQRYERVNGEYVKVEG